MLRLKINRYLAIKFHLTFKDGGVMSLKEVSLNKELKKTQLRQYQKKCLRDSQHLLPREQRDIQSITMFLR